MDTIYAKIIAVITESIQFKGAEAMKPMPKDSMILLSYINTQLRDFYSSLEELCADTGWNEQEITNQLAQVDYHYDPAERRFI